MKTGWEFQKLTDLGWKNVITTMDDKPESITFETRLHVEEVVNGIRHMLQPGDYRVHEVTINE